MANTLSDRPEPVVYANLAQALIAFTVAMGWLSFDDATISTIATVVGGIIYFAITYVTRSAVTPVADPKNENGTALKAVGPAGGTPS